MKILYMMWIDWKWIYQRPQIVAQGLEKYYDVTVAFPRNLINRWKFQQNKYPDKFEKIYVAPFYDKIGFMSKLMDASVKWHMRHLSSYDIIWIAWPLFGEFIPDSFSGKIIYDCMDNHAALSGTGTRAERLERAEKQLIARADLVFATSSLLKDKIERNGGKAVLARNGYLAEEKHRPVNGKRKDMYRLGYIGTISGWMDFPLIEDSLLHFPNIEYRLIGTLTVGRLDHAGVHYDGIVEHKDLYEHIKDFDCLIMPFIVNDIVLSVDPVKLYEYISYGKCIISVYYPEIERFRDFVYFYHDEAEYIKVLDDLMMKGFPPKYNEEQQKSFLKQNTWEERLKTIRENIEKLSG